MVRRCGLGQCQRDCRALSGYRVGGFDIISTGLSRAVRPTELALVEALPVGQRLVVRVL